MIFHNFRDMSDNPSDPLPVSCGDKSAPSLCRLLVIVLVTGLLLSVGACQPPLIRVNLLVDGEVITQETALHEVGAILNEAGILLGPDDRVLLLGSPISPATTLPASGQVTLIIRRAVMLTLTAPAGEPVLIHTSAQTVGQALLETGIDLHPADRFSPSLQAPIVADMTISWQPASELIIHVDGAAYKVRSAAATVGAALAETGFPLMGLDYSLPTESAPLPTDGQIKIVRVREDVNLTLKSIPYDTRTELSADLEIDQRALLQAGEPGLAISRLRTRLEDGVQIVQISESESLIRPPQDEVLGIGTKIVIRTTVVDGVTIEYWRALNLFATYYVPCGAGQPRCYYGTASGTLVRKGAVAFVYPWYLLFAGEHLYVPGYGFAIVEDNNGAATNAMGDTYWIDLGYSMEDVVDWTNRYVTVYFLTPVPANVADTYILP